MVDDVDAHHERAKERGAVVVDNGGVTTVDVELAQDEAQSMLRGFTSQQT